MSFSLGCKSTDEEKRCPAVLAELILSNFYVSTAADLPYVVDLEYKNKESLGFLPKMAFPEQRVTAGRVFLGRLNGEPFGYLLFDYRPHDLSISLQACTFNTTPAEGFTGLHSTATPYSNGTRTL